MSIELDRSRLSPMARRVLDARDQVLRAIEHLDTPEAMMVLQYTTASWLAQIVATTSHDNATCVEHFATAVYAVLEDPAHLLAPVRRQ